MEEQEYVKMGKLEKTHWYFVAKRKFLDVVLNAYASQKAKILDVGCGTGAVMEHLLENNNEVCGVDMNDVALEFCRQKGLDVKKGLADNMPFQDDYFDIVLALDVLEHLDHPEAAVVEVKRILKKGGLFIVTVPAHQWLWSYHDESLHHKKRYNKKDLSALFVSGFEIEKISWINFFILFPAIILRLLKRFAKSSSSGSDVKNSPAIFSIIISFVYFIELRLFKIFGGLPAGLSVLAVVKKK
jgi:ubiquinone/menaquinone biosynthesis C-methylase UbiE